VTNLKRRGPLPRPPADPIEAAMFALRQIPEAKRYRDGRALIGLIVEFCLKNPARAALVEEVAVLCGKSIVAAQDIRCAVERAALDQRPAAPPRRADFVTVNVRAAEWMRGQSWLERDPARRGEYDPFDNDRIWGDE
jgi:hypothetical protein